ncbi:hypothetical protein A0H81_10666 [Grifola frondosa]|uniref:DUF6534 domain-containing protein n=1 Tax=Grifola frondosa TaxID=5627 RepID=A0A1C7LY79_GRIFR|nr:hypothetical protein A0H81_10666 [Grifola frondosa]
MVSAQLDGTMGALLLGSYLGTMTYGLTTHQTYRYFRLYPGDGWKLKGMVVRYVAHCPGVTLLLLLSGEQLCAAESSFDCGLVIQGMFMGYFQRMISILIFNSQLLVGIAGLMTTGSHLFYTRRVYCLGNRNLPLAAILCILAFLKICAHAGVTAEAFLLGAFDKYVKFTWLISTALALAATSDALITISLCLFLRRSRTGPYRKTDSFIDIIIVYTVNTGFLTWQVFEIPRSSDMLVVMPNNLVYFAIYIVGSKTYTNSMLTVLNSRRSLQDKGAEGFETGSFGVKNITERRNSIQWETPVLPLKVPTKQTVIDVIVTTETFHHVDEEASVVQYPYHLALIHDDPEPGRSRR